MPRAVVKERARRLRQKGSQAYGAHLAREVEAGRRGAVRQALMESETMGRTAQFMPVLCRSQRSVGEIVELRITGEDGERLLAA